MDDADPSLGPVFTVSEAERLSITLNQHRQRVPDDPAQTRRYFAGDLSRPTEEETSVGAADLGEEELVAQNRLVELEEIFGNPEEAQLALTLSDPGNWFQSQSGFEGQTLMDNILMNYKLLEDKIRVLTDSIDMEQQATNGSIEKERLLASRRDVWESILGMVTDNEENPEIAGMIKKGLKKEALK